MDECPEQWSLEAIKEVYDTPVFELIHRANAILRSNFPHSELQTCYLVSIKTGGCTEDCAYCAQSSRYQTNVKPEPMMKITEVMDRAKHAVDSGATRVCLGAAWREVKDNHQFDRTLEMIKGITNMGAEVCCALGMLTASQAKKLYEAGLHAYNHNLDSSEGFYKTIITTRKYEDRLKTLDVVEKSGIRTCCGGIVGMGETSDDRIGLLHTLACRERMPESVPVNVLWPIEGTPLQDQESISFWEILRTIATVRVIFPHSMVRLAAGRAFLSVEQQTLCFIAGANSIFYGEKLLTVDNNGINEDTEMLNLLGMRHRSAFSVKRGQSCQSATC
ncbi:Biotin synthase,biotin synthase,biotin synthase,Biotin and Thiamin Synthesis associated domain [Chlamydia poikilotherma]|uniref:Biotin synthase n=1 Tax=Chlamydia poikilotherma TaxID=1967783 RepID=A0A3B0PWD5_9CHLA|nr:biotin synthase BioB [Chlamydia poikilotherma]SYX09186.1 Biotin synthase,biotin synthase,biotin synthase,Biotin and Thiamin Synthesis associated domain [Chlamydia poikilotherma]